MNNQYDVIVVGAGAAGLAAAVYTNRYAMKTLAIGADFGGETATAGLIENWPGTKSIDGYELISNMREHAKETGAELKEGKVTEIKKEGDCFDVVTEAGERMHARSVILATGAQRRHLGLPREDELTGKGVHYCVTCDGPVYKDKVVAMVGGGDSSVKGVNFLGEYASKIYFITREKEPHGEPANMKRMEKFRDKIVLLTETEVKELIGEQKLQNLKLSKAHEGSDEIAVDGLFVEIGFDPDQTFPKQLGLKTDDKGYMETDNLMNTNVPGVFVAGDATNHFGAFKQDITAAALGTVAATSAYDHINSVAACAHK